MTTAVTAENVLGVLVMHYQPIVSLSDESVVGYEALARFPGLAGAPSTPQVFREARELGIGRELERKCRRSAIAGAREHAIRSPSSIFVNVESSMIDTISAHETIGSGRDVIAGLSIVLELTERGILDDPASVMRCVWWAARNGVGIALDDVGVTPESAALIPLICPDIVKLTPEMLDDDESAERLVAAARWVDAAVVCEGIETDAHRVRAVELGADFGQGFLLGRPAALHGTVPPRIGAPAFDARARPEIRSSAQLWEWATGIESGTVDDVLATAAAIETEALGLPEKGLVLSQCSMPDRWADDIDARYRALAEHHVLVAALGVDTEGLRHGVRSEPDAFLVVVLTTDHAKALVGRHRSDDYDTCEWFVTTDTDTVRSAAQMLFADIDPRD